MEEQEARISFVMTAEDYAAAEKFHQSVLQKRIRPGVNWLRPVLLSAVFALLLLFCVLTRDYFFIVPVLLAMGVWLFLGRAGLRVAAANMYAMDKVLSCTHTISLNSAGIRVINGFEKLFVPWNEFCALRETKRYLLLQCELGGTAVAVEKSRVAPAALEAFLPALRGYVQRRRADESNS